MSREPPTAGPGEVDLPRRRRARGDDVGDAHAAPATATRAGGEATAGREGEEREQGREARGHSRHRICVALRSISSAAETTLELISYGAARG